MSRLLARLGSRVSPAAVSTELALHPGYPSLRALFELLDRLGLACAAELMGASKLEGRAPCIAHHRGRFVVVERVRRGVVEYDEPFAGRQKDRLERFSEGFSGAILRPIGELKPTPLLGRLQERTRRERGLRRLLMLLAAGWVARVLAEVPASSEQFVAWAILVVTNCAGLAAVGALIGLEMGRPTALGRKLCPILEEGSGCARVLSSRGSRLGGISAADLGVWYFSAQHILLLLASGSGRALWTAFGVLGGVGLALAAVAVAYQGLVVRAWCKLCLLIHGLIAVQGAAIFVSLAREESRLWGTAALDLAVALAAGAALWTVAKPALARALAEPGLRFQWRRTLRTRQVGCAVLEASRPIEFGSLAADVAQGPEGAPWLIGVVAGAGCPSCGLTVPLLLDLQRGLPERVALRVRLIPEPGADPEVERVTTGAVQAALRGQSAAAAELLYEHYAGGGPRPSEEGDERIEGALGSHVEWCRRAQITTTPTIVVNGREVPGTFSVEDLCFLIREAEERAERRDQSVSAEAGAEAVALLASRDRR